MPKSDVLTEKEDAKVMRSSVWVMVAEILMGLVTPCIESSPASSMVCGWSLRVFLSKLVIIPLKLVLGYW